MKHTATAPPAYPSRRRGGRRFAMDYHRGDTLVAQRTYAYDQLGRPTARTVTRQGSTRTDAYTYNNRSELIGDVVDGTDLNGWDYDNIGNRRMEHRSDGYEIYTANNLNQYTAIEDQEGTFQPAYDDDGNQTSIKTSTGIRNVTYNAKNRPILFTKDDNSVSVECTYDYMGRRATKKVTENGTVTLHQRYLYRGYLQIDSPPPHLRLTPAGQHRSAGCPPGLTAVGRVACCDLLRPAHPCIWLITWDPTQDVATRPLAVQKDGTWYTYGWDLTKNVWEVYGTTGYIGTAYTYTAYGQVTASGAIEQPIQWSSEYNDTELALVYYNYRHYNHSDGRWIGRDYLKETIYRNRYIYANNGIVGDVDFLGLSKITICNKKTLNQKRYIVSKVGFGNANSPSRFDNILDNFESLYDDIETLEDIIGLNDLSQIRNIYDIANIIAETLITESYGIESNRERLSKKMQVINQYYKDISGASIDVEITAELCKSSKLLHWISLCIYPEYEWDKVDSKIYSFVVSRIGKLMERGKNHTSINIKKSNEISQNEVYAAIEAAKIAAEKEI